VTGIKISNNKKKEHYSKNLTLNASIIILILINVYLGYTTTKTVTSYYNNNQYELSKDSTASKIQIEVLNGCGKTGVAEKLTDYLRAKGFDVVRLGNYRSFEIENSIVISRNDKIQNAEKVATVVGLNYENVIQQINPEYLLDVTFILGKDYKNLIPLQKRLN
jgi:hypothetical protein